jgi:hypothetical protein
MERKPRKKSPDIHVTPFPLGTPPILPVIPSDEARDLVSVPWSLARVEDSEKRLVIVYRRRHEHKIIGVRVEDLDESVELTLLAEYTKVPGSRTLSGVSMGFSVLLNSPLGARTLLHAPTA